MFLRAIFSCGREVLLNTEINAAPAGGKETRAPSKYLTLLQILCLLRMCRFAARSPRDAEGQLPSPLPSARSEETPPERTPSERKPLRAGHTTLNGGSQRMGSVEQEVVDLASHVPP